MVSDDEQVDADDLSASTLAALQAFMAERAGAAERAKKDPFAECVFIHIVQV